MRWIRLAAVTAALLVAATAHAVPKWFTATEYGKYTPETHYLGTGSGQTLEEAVFRAQHAIAAQIETAIEGEFTSVVQSYRVDDRETIREQASSTVKSVVKGQLAGAETVESTQEEGTYYALVVMDKQTYGRVVRQKADELSATLESLQASYQRLVSGGQVFEAIELLLGAEETARELAATAAIVTTVTGKSYDGFVPGFSGPEILAQVRETLGDVRIKDVAGDNQLGKRGNLLPEPLVVEVYHKAGGKSPMQGVALRLLDDDGRRVDRGWTGSDGKAEFYARAVGERRGRYEVAMDLVRMPRVLRDQLEDLRATFKYDVASTPPLTFAIDIRGVNGGTDREVTKNVAQSVEKTGHNISSDAAFLLFGELRRVGDAKEVETPGGSLTQVTVEMQLFLRDQGSGETFASTSVRSVGQSRGGADDALRAASTRMRVSSRDMSKLLAEAEDKMGGHLEAMSSGHLKQGRKLWAEGKVEAALRELSMVTHGEANVKAAEALIEEIRASRQQDEQDQAVQRAARVAGREDQGADPEELAKRMEAVRASLVAATWVNYAEDAEYGELSFAEEGTYALDGETAGDWELISPTQVAMDVGEGVRVSAEISGDGGSITFEGETFMKQ